jgi:putative chitinase
MSLTITVEHLVAIAGRTTPLMPDLAEWLNRLCPLYEIDVPQEYCHFLAQACHETDHFKTLREYASGNAYEGRQDLGNTQPGDGVRFKGRGIFQTTGRANYLELGIKKGRRDMFVDTPELLEQPEYAVWSACEYWKTRGLNDIANHADSDVLKKKYRGAVLDLSPVEYISYRVNGGNRGLDERKKFYLIAQRVLTEPAAPRLVRARTPAGKRAKKRKPPIKRASTRSRRTLREKSSASRAKPARASHRKR